MKVIGLILFSIFIIITFFLNTGCAAQKESVQKPNIILIMADDVGTECFNLYGGQEYKTPNLDSLANSGKLFTHCYSQPLCTPSRVQIMTGRYNNRNYKGFGWLDPKEITFANVLKSNGYSTCIAGKWQLGGNAEKIQDFGFDRHCLWNMHKYAKDDKDGMRDPEGWLQRYDNPTLFQNGQWQRPGKDKFGPDECTKFICDFIEKQNTPFLVYYPMILPHSPFVPTPSSKSRTQSNKQNFIDMTEYIDKLVGKILHSLEKSGKRKDTIIIFTSDNGTHKSIGSKTIKGQVKGAKASMTDAGTHVPMVINWPEKISPSVCKQITDFSDILPTLVDLAAAKLPKELHIDGVSLLPTLMDKKKNHRDTIFCYYWDYGRNPNKARAFVRNHKYKLYDDNSLYDVENDRLEKSKLTDQRYDAIRKLLNSALENYLKSKQ
jgi:arylsulfatase A